MTLSRGSGPRAAAGLRDRVAFFGAFLGAFFAAGIPESVRDRLPLLLRHHFPSPVYRGEGRVGVRSRLASCILFANDAFRCAEVSSISRNSCKASAETV